MNSKESIYTRFNSPNKTESRIYRDGHWTRVEPMSVEERCRNAAIVLGIEVQRGNIGTIKAIPHYIHD